MSWLRRIWHGLFPDDRMVIDLHGLRVPQALAVVERALADAEREQRTLLRIICGKGRHSPGGVGVLREAVAGWLDRHGYAGRYRREVDRDGRDGVLSVTVRGADDCPPGG